MATYQQAAPAPARTDVAAWALVAVIVAIICAGAGWAIARNDVPGRDDLARTSDLAARDGLMRGQATGYAQGAKLGRREAALQSRSAMLAAKAEAQREGYANGYANGRSKAGDPDAYLNTGLGMGAGFAGSSAEDEALLATGVYGGDVPGFSDSAYDSLGYGSDTSTPYLGAASAGATSVGDTGLGY
jgi:hypothetical protein